MLTSKYEEDFGSSIGSGSWANDVFDRQVLSETRDFSVSPNPCSNVGDHKHPNAYSFVKRKIRRPHGRQNVVAHYNNPASVHTSSISGPLPEALPWEAGGYRSPPLSDAYNRALEKLMNSLRSSELNVSTSIGEGKETFDMMKSIARSSLNAIKLLRGARTKEGFRALVRAKNKTFSDLGKNPLGQVGGAWLAWSVGLKPLLQDIDNFRNHVLSDRQENIRFNLVSRASSLAVDQWSQTASGHEWKMWREYSHRVQFGATFCLTDYHQFENWRAGLTLRPSLAWELTTLSFVVDYFYNVGQYLQLFEASVMNNGVSWEFGYCTITTRDFQTKELRYWSDQRNPDGSPDYSVSRNYQGFKLETTKSRSVLASFPLPQPPILKIPSAATPLLNIAALLAQFLSEK